MPGRRVTVGLFGCRESQPVSAQLTSCLDGRGRMVITEGTASWRLTGKPSASCAPSCGPDSVLSTLTRELVPASAIMQIYRCHETAVGIISGSYES